MPIAAAVGAGVIGYGVGLAVNKIVDKFKALAYCEQDFLEEVIV